MDSSESLPSRKRRKVDYSNDILRRHPNLAAQLSANVSDDQEDQCEESEPGQDETLSSNQRSGTSHRSSPATMPPSCKSPKNGPVMLPSPFQLTYIPGLPKEDNVDAVRLTDLLGDPLIKEAWQFNYMFDLDFLMCVNF
jgi:tyrosyl-DNA phosphodiesterase-1